MPDNATVLDRDKRDDECLSASQRIHQISFLGSSKGYSGDSVNRNAVYGLFITYGEHVVTLYPSSNPHSCWCARRAESKTRCAHRASQRGHHTIFLRLKPLLGAMTIPVRVA